MKKQISITVLLVVSCAIGYALIHREPVEYVAPTTEIKQVIKQEVNNISEAQKQLDEAKKLLEEEENKILAEIKEREGRLEEIRKVRLSFSQAPKQVE
jgi:hypothetical protein